MPFKRLAPSPVQSECQYQPSSSRPSKQFKASTPALSGVKIYLVQAKLDVATVAKLYALAELHSQGVCKNAEDADVIVTTVAMRRRLERHVPWEIAVSQSTPLR